MERENAERLLLPNRREVLALGASGALTLLGFASARGLAVPRQERGFQVTPPVTEGPYFVDERLLRKDLRTDPESGVAQAGFPVTLGLRLSRLDGEKLSPLSGAYVDLWHANAKGLYSDVSQNRTAGQRFLRGSQIMDRAGKAQFVTIYPGWYPGRAVHIHAKVRYFTGNQTIYDFTTQIFFDETITDQIYAAPPYSSRGTRTTVNRTDMVYTGGSDDGVLRTNAGALLLPRWVKNSSHVSGEFHIVLRG